MDPEHDRHSARAGHGWTDGLDPEEVNAALEEATVDAHDEDERHSGLLNAVQDEVSFPFRARVLGEEVEVVGREWPEDDALGLDLVCERRGATVKGRGPQGSASRFAILPLAPAVRHRRAVPFRPGPVRAGCPPGE